MSLTKRDLKLIRGIVQDENKLQEERIELKIEAATSRLSKEIAETLDRTVLDQLDEHDERIGKLETAVGA